MTATVLSDSRYKVYPEYKDSGVEWFNSIPSHWLVSRLKFCSDINMGQSPNSDDCNIDGLGLPFLQGNAEFGVKYPTEKQFCPVPRKVAKVGELLFSVRAPVGALNFANKEYGIGRGLCSIKNKATVEQSFLWWVLPTYKKQFDAVSTGSTFEAVSAEQVGNLAFALPTQDEQQKIADFLDHETAKIDTLIAKQETLIALLKEKRQAVISHAVTRGLNPDAPMKDSGVEWLGEVPEHWEVKKLKYIIATLESGVSVNSESTPASNQEFGVLKTSCVYTREFRVEENKKVLLEEYDRVKCSVRKNALIISRMNTPELVGAAAFSDSDHKNLFLPDRLWQTIFFDDKRQNPKFISYFMTTKFYRDAIAIAATGTSSSMQNIAKEDLLNIELPFPSRKEQNLICETLSSKLQKMDLLISRSNGAINLIKERKTALISAAVTGKIDVRHFTLKNEQPTKTSLNNADTACTIELE